MAGCSTYIPEVSDNNETAGGDWTRFRVEAFKLHEGDDEGLPFA